jgi:hypothetical protein
MGRRFSIALSLFHAFMKVLGAHSHGAGAPLLDGYIFPPIFLGVGSAVFFRHYHVKMSGIVVGIGAFIILFATYEIARRIGTRSRH